MTGFYAVPLFGLVELARGVRTWLEAPDLAQLARLMGLGAVITGVAISLHGLSPWIAFYVVFGVLAGSLLRQSPTTDVPTTWAPVLLVCALCAAELTVFQVWHEGAGAWRGWLSLTWGGLLAVVAFRYSRGLGSGCSTLFGAMIAWVLATIFVGFVRDLAFSCLACLCGLLLPGPPSWVGPIVETATQLGFDAAALGVVWLAAAIAQEDVLAGHEPDAGLYLKLIRERMMRGEDAHG